MQGFFGLLFFVELQYTGASVTDWDKWTLLQAVGSFAKQGTKMW